MPKFKLSTLVLAVLVAVAFNVSIFANGQTEKKDQAVTVKIAFPVAVDAPIVGILDGYAKDFMSEHPNVTVEPVYAGGYTDVQTMVQTTIDGGGDAPALAILLASNIYDLANAKYVVPMTKYLDKMKDKEAYLQDFLPAFMTNSTYNGEIYSFPFQRSDVILYFNADLIEKAGLQVPDSWDSLAKTAQALTVRNGDKVSRWGIEWPSGWPYWLFQPIAMGAGQNIVGESDTQVFFDNPDVIKAIEFYNSLSDKYEATPKGVQASWGNVVPNFVSGNTAMIVHSSGSLSKILSQANFKVGVMGVPGEKAGTQFSVPGGGNIYMIAGTTDAQQQAAFDFAVFMTDPDRAAKFSIATGYIATRKSSMDNADLKAYIAKNPQVIDVNKALASAGKEFSIQNLGQVRTIFHKYLQAAFNGEMSASEAMNKAQTESDQSLADFR